MKIVVDDKIPYINEAIGRIADEVVYMPGSRINRDAVKDADALIIRTRTHCGRELLEGSKVRFIATATIGYDHIDTAYCTQAGIAWTNAPGSNSSSVAQYIESSLILLKHKGYTLEGKTIGIVGAGNVGEKIAPLALRYGMNVLINDPPREEAEGKGDFITLREIAGKCDIITFHTPLLRDGSHKTFHLADESFFRSLGKKPVIINTSRGEVIETNALLDALKNGIISDAIIDVWENEPHINKELLAKAYISTPHIAGYSADGKANATRMSLQALCKHFNKPFDCVITPPPPPENNIIWSGPEEEILLRIYNPENDSRRLKDNPEQFEWLRGNYPVRREKDAY